MATIKKAFARRVVKSTAKHSARGTASKLKRDPVRAVTLLGLGGAVGAVAGWIAGRTATGAASVSTGS
ncbi:MAG: hypothetical protein ACTHK6_08775 [Solirubrobacterales bacterium]